jgi:hypothetical protein
MDEEEWMKRNGWKDKSAFSVESALHCGICMRGHEGGRSAWLLLLLLLLLLANLMISYL